MVKKGFGSPGKFLLYHQEKQKNDPKFYILSFFLLNLSQKVNGDESTWSNLYSFSGQVTLTSMVMVILMVTLVDTKNVLFITYPC